MASSAQAELKLRIERLRRFEKSVERAELAVIVAKKILKAQRERLDRDAPGWDTKRKAAAKVTAIDRGKTG